MSAPMTPERLAEIRKAAEAIEHRHVGPGRCSCGYDAYAERGIMLDYHALIVNHFDRVKRNPVRPANTEHVKELLAEVARLTHLLGSHADGHRCTCTMTDPGIRHGDNAHPPEWEQDPWCPTHPDMDVILTEVARLRAQVAVAESFTAERPAYIQAIKASPHADADYWRWQGHAESRRHLSERLAALDSDGLGLWTVPDHLIGDLT